MSETAKKSQGSNLQKARYHAPEGYVVVDCIPFFHKGIYHVFYLHGVTDPDTRWQVDWAHISSFDLVHWTEHPLAIKRGKPGEMDSGAIYTGSAIEKDGIFHIFYTGHTPGHPQGRENILHATSDDLIHWQKDKSGPVIMPDGKYYSNKKERDWRDPFVFLNSQEKCYWMLITTSSANPVNGFLRGTIGLATSPDLKTWQLEPPIYSPQTSTQMECPDMFEMNGRWYMILTLGGDMDTIGLVGVEYRVADSPKGPWRRPGMTRFDGGGFYFCSAKTIWDGERRILFGWAGDTRDGKDSTEPFWGGTLATPRQLVADEKGCLNAVCPDEVIDSFSQTVLDDAGSAKHTIVCGNWSVDGNKFTGTRIDGLSALVFDKIETRQCCVNLTATPKTNECLFGFYIKAQENLFGAYTVIFDPVNQEMAIKRSIPGTFMGLVMPELPHVLVRQHIDIIADKSVKIKALLLDDILEVFTDDHKVLTARLLDLETGNLGLFVAHGQASFESLKVTKVPDRTNSV